MTPDNREEQVREAIAVFDKSAERTRPNAQTAAWATIRAHIEALEADNERLKAAFDDHDETASVHWYMKWVEYKRRAEAAEARVRELEGLLAVAVCPMKASGCDGEQYPEYDGHGDVVGVQCQWCYERKAAIDSAMQGEEVRGG